MKRLSAKTPTNVLCLAVDRLNADFLGAYGNTWIESPAFNALASSSVLFDSYYATSLDLRALYRAFWRGESPATFRVDRGASESDAPVSLFRALKKRGYRTFVVSDVEEITLHDAIDDDCCDGRFFLDSPDAREPVESLEQTRIFRNFEELARFIAKLEDEAELGDDAPWFVWAHFSGWNDLWDWPIDFREAYCEDEEDPAPYAGITPPYFPNLKKSGEKDDKLDLIDLRQSVVEAYAGGVSAFDETLEGFTQLLNEKGVLSKTLFALTGVRGFGTGAPSALGIAPENETPAPFYAEEIRLPLVVRLPDETGATVRLPGLCEPRDLYETFKSWPTFARELTDPEFWKIERSEISPFAGKWSLDEDVESTRVDGESQDAPGAPTPDAPGRNLLPLLVDETGSVRDRIVITAVDADSKERAVVVKEWLLKETPRVERREDEPDKIQELFVLPDDRYCVNDVANRRRDVVEELERLIAD